MSHLCIKYLTQRRTMVTTYNNWSYSNARFTLIIKAKVPESHGDIHNYGKHPTPQKINAYIVNKNSTKQYPAFIEFPFAEFVKFCFCDPNLSSPAQAKFCYFPLLCHVSLHSCSINVCNVTQSSLLTRFSPTCNCLGTKIPQNTFYETASIFD